MKKRNSLSNLLIYSIFLIAAFLFLVSCKEQDDRHSNSLQKPEPKLSLGQWSFHKELFNGSMSNFDFVRKSSELGFDGVEYVNQFFLDKIDDMEFFDSLKMIALESKVNNILLLVDEAGDLGTSDSLNRKSAIDKHKKWIIVAKRIGCPFIRINVRGDGTPEEIKKYSIQSISILSEFARDNNIEVLIENHGGVSNNGAWLADLIIKIDSDNVSALADIDNWCIERENGKLWGAPCINRYDRYKGMNDLMPFAKAISLKSFDFDENGNEKTIDYNKLFKLIKSFQFKGYFGIEYEGIRIPTEEGILKTMHLCRRAWNNN